jgi:threonine dehydrogenase-like Zn-dependent dehydrogenase
MVYLPAKLPGIVYNPQERVHLRHFNPDDLFGRRFVYEKPCQLRRGLLMLRVTSAGICGSDKHFFDNSETAQNELLHDFPLGHEMAGVVIDIGEVHDFKRDDWIGQTVAVESHIPRWAFDWGSKAWHKPKTLRKGYGIIGYHRMKGDVAPGAWTPFVVIPFQNAFRIGENVIKATGGYPSLLEPNGNAIYLIQRLKQLLVDKQLYPERARVVFLGLGLQGKMMMHLTSELGVKHLVGLDVSKAAVQGASQLGVATCLPIETKDDVKHQAENILDHLGNYADIVIDACGYPSNYRAAARAIRPTGEFFLFGLGDDQKHVPGTAITLHDFIFEQMVVSVVLESKAFTFRGIVGRTKDSWHELIDNLDKNPDGTLASLIRSPINEIGPMDKLVTMLPNIHTANDLPPGKIVMRPFEGFA